MSSGPKISIITACYNAEQTIEQTIQSVINQTYDNIEYIVIDGASSDGTMDIVRKYEDHIDIIVSEPDKGIYDAFNKGAKLAKGDYIQYLNADDYLLSCDVISKVGIFIEKDMEQVLVYGGILMFDEATGYKQILKRLFTFDEIQRGKMIPHPATFLRRDVILELGLFNNTYSIAADYDLICKVYKRYNKFISYYPQLITNFRMGGVSSNLKNSEKVLLETQSIANKHFDETILEIARISNEVLLKKWIEKSLFDKKSISDILIKDNVKKVVLWGTGELSVMIYKDLIDHDIEVMFYVDNNKEKQGLSMNNITIMPPECLKENGDQVDCIILSFEGRHEQSVMEQLETYNIASQFSVFSWRDLVMRL